MDKIALFFTAVSAIAAAVAAFFMYRQTKIAIEERRNFEQENDGLKRRENELLAVNNKILINQMWNDFNKTVIEGDESLRGAIGTKNFQGLEPALVRRIYLMFSNINVVEAAWRLMIVGAMPTDQAQAILFDQAQRFKNDQEAARHALTGRGYSQDFLDALWPLVFPDDPTPQAGKREQA
ncbi:hypothetical protein [Pararhizobium sp. IMCC21322]|uniref:hypothetical protein n=1 Tax=Pararhizobium sp. IMCC21322 TaxID=3067903 RepID=UPI0027427F1D|nr:hypothetical protein [Pararhizobium sp. IMCC21322]